MRITVIATTPLPGCQAVAAVLGWDSFPWKVYPDAGGAPTCEGGEASAPCSMGWSLRSSAVRAVRWCCARGRDREDRPAPVLDRLRNRYHRFAGSRGAIRDGAGFASLHQLCGPMLDQLERLPAPQSQALEIAFGERAGPPPDRFLVGLAVLSLFSERAEEGPLLCIVDDAQWVDQESAPAGARSHGSGLRA